MSDKCRTEAIEKLRREVGYGCPICRSPFLTWHHFDPPEHEEEHWRPEGMIALCLAHHPNADPDGVGGNAYSPAEFREMKRKDYSLKDVRDSFISWQKKSVLVRLGGCYTSPSTPILSVSGFPQISLRQNAAGLLALSFQLCNEDGKVLVEMDDNWFTAYPSNIHDMTVAPKTRDVKVWLDKEDVGLELSFRRITMDDLEAILMKDSEHAKGVWHKMQQARRQEELEQVPPAQREDWLEMMRELWATLDDWNADPVAEAVKQWVTANCQMDDALIPILNFEQMAICFHGHRFVVKDGMADSIIYCVRLNREGGYNLKCPCPKCVDIQGSI